MEEELSNRKTKDKNLKNKEKNDKEKYQISEKTRNIVFDILVVACVIMLAIAVTPKTMQNDTYYNIKCGEYLVQNGIFGQTEDPFSWHDLSYTWPHWLFDILIYLFYAICGNFWEIGIYAATIFFTAVLGLSMYKLCLQTTKNNRVISMLAALFRTLYYKTIYSRKSSAINIYFIYLGSLFYREIIRNK